MTGGRGKEGDSAYIKPSKEWTIPDNVERPFHRVLSIESGALGVASEVPRPCAVARDLGATGLVGILSIN